MYRRKPYGYVNYINALLHAYIKYSASRLGKIRKCTLVFSISAKKSELSHVGILRPEISAVFRESFRNVDYEFQQFAISWLL